MHPLFSFSLIPFDKLSKYLKRHSHKYYREHLPGLPNDVPLLSPSFAVSHGHACQKQATSPQNVGDANEVPLARDTVPSFPATAELTPTAITSGFTRPSAVLPTEEKSAFTRFFIHSTHSNDILRISRRSQLLPSTATGIAGTAHHYQSFIGSHRSRM